MHPTSHNSKHGKAFVKEVEVWRKMFQKEEMSRKTGDGVRERTCWMSKAAHTHGWP